LRPGDTVARFGGDEFTVLLTELDDVRRALRVTQRISQALAGPINIDGHDLCLSGSIGIAFSSPEYDRPEAILHAADLAMYQAKAQGKPYPIIYDPALYSDRTQQSREPASPRSTALQSLFLNRRGNTVMYCNTYANHAALSEGRGG
jgi:GGDEF domain-containing protein